MADDLNPRQSQFVAEYLKDKNATQAAIRAGYSKRSAASIGEALLRKTEISEKLTRVLKDQELRTEITADRILSELYRIGTCDVAGAFDDVGALLPLKQIPIDVRRAISSIEVDEIWEMQKGDEDERPRKVQIGETKKVKFWNKVDSLGYLGKHLELFVEKVKLVGSNPHTVHDIDETIVMLQRLKKAMQASGGE